MMCSWNEDSLSFQKETMELSTLMAQVRGMFWILQRDSEVTLRYKVKPRGARASGEPEEV
jgi:hypothetical protein